DYAPGIEARQMEHPMHHEMPEMIRQGLVLLGRLAPYRLKGEHDVAEQYRHLRSHWLGAALRESQHIGRLICRAVRIVEMPLLGIIGQRNIDDEPAPAGGLGKRRP